MKLKHLGKIYFIKDGESIYIGGLSDVRDFFIHDKIK